MCWISMSKPELKVAEDNIPVTKIVGIRQNVIRAYYKGEFKYSIGEIYHSKITLSPAWKCYRITEGFHSYESSCRITISKLFLYPFLTVRLPLMLVQYDMSSIDFFNLGIMSCIIPKGSKYYENENGEVVSDTIKPIYCYKIK